MSEETNTEATMPAGSTEVEIIAAETMLDITMSSGYYNRIRTIVQNMITDHSEEIESAHNQIQSQKIEDTWVYDYETLLILCNDFEKKAREAGFIKKVPYEEAVRQIASQSGELAEEETTAPPSQEEPSEELPSDEVDPTTEA
jgi:hypothetical protein